MLELIKYVVNQFAENPDEIEYLVEEKGNKRISDHRKDLHRRNR